MRRLLFFRELGFFKFTSHRSSGEHYCQPFCPCLPLFPKRGTGYFSMRLNQWPNGEPIKVFVLPDDYPLHKAFVKGCLNLFPHQLRSIWNQSVYSGTGVAPTQVSSPEEMLQASAPPLIR